MRFAVVLLSVVAVCSAVEVSQLPAAPVGCVPAVIPANTVLYHGTSVAQFALNYFNPVPAGAYNTGSANHPGGPGWFASTLGFAFHAGFRHLGANGNGYLFHYTANADIPVLNCDTHAALYGNNGFLHASGFAPGAILNNDVTGARTFCTNIGDYLAGYIIHADRIRAQPEVIICQPDQWLNFVQRDVVAITVHAGAGGGNTHPQAAAGGTTLTFAHNAINMRLWWPPVGPNLLNDLINTATNAAILLESESKAVVRVSSTSAAHDIGAVVAKLKVKKLTKPASVKKGDPAKDVKKDENDKAVKKEENGSIAFWDKEAVDKAEAAKVKGKKFSARRLGALKPY